MAQYIEHPALRGMEMGNQRSAQRTNLWGQAITQYVDALNKAAMADRAQAYDSMRRQAEIAAGVGLPEKADAAKALEASKSYFKNIEDYYNRNRSMLFGETPEGQIFGPSQVPPSQGAMLVGPNLNIPSPQGQSFGGFSTGDIKEKEMQQLKQLEGQGTGLQAKVKKTRKPTTK